MRTMINRRFFLLSLMGSVVGFFVCALTFAADTLPTPATPGTFTFTIKSGGFDRVAHVHIPTEYKSGTKPPLVLVLHGAGGTGTGTLERDNWTSKADQEGCLNNLKGVIEAVEEDGVLILHRYTVRWDRGEIERRVEPTMLDAID